MHDPMRSYGVVVRKGKYRLLGAPLSDRVDGGFLQAEAGGMGGHHARAIRDGAVGSHDDRQGDPTFHPQPLCGCRRLRRDESDPLGRPVRRLLHFWSDR